MDSELVAFGEGLPPLELTEVECAIALLWFLEQKAGQPEASAAELGKLIHDLSLRSQVNTWRLSKALGKHPDIVKGNKVGNFKLKLGSKAALATRYEPLMKRPIPKVESHVIPSEDFIATRRYLETLVFQINGTYQFGFYDGCAVLCRRLVETLLIESFEKTGIASIIKQNNSYLQLSDIVALATSGQHIRLARGSGDALTEIKEMGDAAAHSRTYITKQKDIDHIRMKLRRIVSELQHLAKIEPSKSTDQA
jgi:hypothetical protein